MKPWQKLLLAVIIMVAAVLALMYRQSNYESPESIVTAVPANSDNTLNGVPPSGATVETTPVAVVPTQIPTQPTPPVQVEVPEPETPVALPEYQATNLVLEPLMLGTFGAHNVRSYDLDATDWNAPEVEDKSIPGVSYDTLLQPMRPGMETEGVSQELSNLDMS